MPKKTKKQKKYKFELTPLSALFWGIFLIILLTWIFVLGILVGRGFLPGSVSTISDLKNQVKKLQTIVGKKEEYEDIKPADENKDPELAFYEKLNSKKDEVKRTKLPEKKEEATDEITLFREPPEKEITEPEQEKTKAEIDTAEKKDDSKAKAPPSISSGQQFTVQILSTVEREKAEKETKSLVDRGYDAYYYTAEVRGTTYYRIRCGRFEDRESALEYSRKLEKETGYKGFVARVE